MSNLQDFLTILFGIPIAFVVGCYLGRKYQRSHWMLDRPYSERVDAIKSKR